MVSNSISFPSINSNVHKAEQFCRSFLESIISDEDLIDNILIVLTELVNNAIIHGNENNPHKLVSVDFHHNPQKKEILCRVIDEGKGFSDKDLTDPTQENNLLKTSGRGIYIVKHFVSSFSHYVKNNKHVVEVKFHYS